MFDSNMIDDDYEDSIGGSDDDLEYRDADDSYGDDSEG
ncbi:MAG: PRC-barrel domain containing protein, partial [Thermoguttaceae bacterium]|nr:PRC-barrel domain containing protein [Thermoguttaceae bacterium]